MKQLAEMTRSFVEALLRLDSNTVAAILAKLSSEDEGLGSFDKVVVPALEYIGQAWEEGRVALSQVYMAGRICESVLGEALPANRFVRAEQPRLAIGVLEDHHALGKRMVLSALWSSGYQLLDYGHGLKPPELIEKAQQNNIDVLLISCLMLASAVRAADVVNGLQKAGCPTLVVVGGAPFRLAPRLWQEVGAGAMGRNSADAVKIVQDLTEKKE